MAVFHSTKCQRWDYTFFFMIRILYMEILPVFCTEKESLLHIFLIFCATMTFSLPIYSTLYSRILTDMTLA